MLLLLLLLLLLQSLPVVIAGLFTMASYQDPGIQPWILTSSSQSIMSYVTHVCTEYLRTYGYIRTSVHNLWMVMKYVTYVSLRSYVRNVPRYVCKYVPSYLVQ